VQPRKPFVLVHDDLFDILGESPTVEVIAQRDYAFAHEAGVYIADTDEVWFTSNILADPAGSRRVDISRISLASKAIFTESIDRVPMGNGACAFRNGLLFCEQGSSTSPSQLVLVDPRPPYRSQIILNNYHGRPFNSLNDVIVTRHPSGELIWFTDPPYGHEQGFRPACQLPPAAWCFDPETGVVRMVADGIEHPNGIAFSPDGKTCYITDTSHIHGSGRLDPRLQSTMWVPDLSPLRPEMTADDRYAFDVHRPEGAPGVPGLRNRRLFAFADCGVPDGSESPRHTGLSRMHVADDQSNAIPRAISMPVAATAFTYGVSQIPTGPLLSHTWR
jgi:gluconolactonase